MVSPSSLWGSLLVVAAPSPSLLPHQPAVLPMPCRENIALFKRCEFVGAIGMACGLKSENAWGKKMLEDDELMVCGACILFVFFLGGVLASCMIYFQVSKYFKSSGGKQRSEVSRMGA